jgi:hypothetical protein
MTEREDLISVAKVVGADWTEGPYYDEAEAAQDDDAVAPAVGYELELPRREHALLHGDVHLVQ